MHGRRLSGRHALSFSTLTPSGLAASRRSLNPMLCSGVHGGLLPALHDSRSAHLLGLTWTQRKRFTSQATPSHALRKLSHATTRVSAPASVTSTTRSRLGQATPAVPR